MRTGQDLLESLLLLRYYHSDKEHSDKTVFRQNQFIQEPNTDIHSHDINYHIHIEILNANAARTQYSN